LPINGFIFDYAICLPYPCHSDIKHYSNRLARIPSKFALLEQARTVKKVAVVVRKISGRGQEKAKYGLRKQKEEITLPIY
jgi:hypothetical protein